MLYHGIKTIIAIVLTVFGAHSFAADVKTVGSKTSTACARSLEENDIDLRNPDYAPAINQTYIQDSEVKLTYWCQAFALANLIGQIKGVAVSPEDLAIGFGYEMHYGQPFVTPNDPASSVLPSGGDIKTVEVIARRRGIAPSHEFAAAFYDGDRGPGWFLKLVSSTDRKTRDRFIEEVNNIGLPRVNITNLPDLVYEQRKGSGRDSSVYKNVPKVSRDALMKRLEAVLSKGHMVAIVYNWHYVTVVGRKEGSYIIQDSIPLSYYNAHPLEQRFYRTEGENFQYWKRDVLMNALDEIAYYPE